MASNALPNDPAGRAVSRRIAGDSAALPPGMLTTVQPLHFTPPTPRALRAQAVHRLQVGLFGLAGMLLLVGLANIIMDRAKLAEAAAPPVSGIAGAAPQAGGGESPASDPLVDMGVVPELPVSESPVAGAPQGAATPQAPPRADAR